MYDEKVETLARSLDPLAWHSNEPDAERRKASAMATAQFYVRYFSARAVRHAQTQTRYAFAIGVLTGLIVGALTCMLF